jgi:hypothetical protein
MLRSPNVSVLALAARARGVADPRPFGRARLPLPFFLRAEAVLVDTGKNCACKCCTAFGTSLS